MFRLRSLIALGVGLTLALAAQQLRQWRPSDCGTLRSIRFFELKS